MRLYVCLCIVQIKQFWILNLNLRYAASIFGDIIINVSESINEEK